MASRRQRQFPIKSLFRQQNQGFSAASRIWFLHCKNILFLGTMSSFISDEAAHFLNLRRLPGRLTLVQAAVLLGIGEHDIACLIKTRLLLPLGNPENNAPKFFAARHVEDMARDVQKMDKIVKTISRHWRAKNGRQTMEMEARDAATSSGDFLESRKRGV
jgi:hypothetical protein